MITFVLMLSAQAYEPDPFGREVFEWSPVAVDEEDMARRVRTVAPSQELAFEVVAPDLSSCLDSGTPGVDGGTLVPLDSEDGDWLVVELVPAQAPLAVHGVAMVLEHGMVKYEPCPGCAPVWTQADATLPHDFAVRAGPAGVTGGAPTAGAQVWSSGTLSDPTGGFNLTWAEIDIDGDGVVDPLVVMPGESLFVAVEMRSTGARRMGVPMCEGGGPPGWWAHDGGRAGWDWADLADFAWGDTSPLVWAWGYTLSQ